MFLKPIQKIKIISAFLDKIASRAILPFFCLLITLDVCLRYFFSMPIYWSTEVNGILLLFFFMCAMPHRCETGGHVSLDLLYNRLGPKRRAFSDFATALAGLTLSLAIVYGSILAVNRMIRTNDALIMVDFPKWPLATFIGLIGFFLVIQFLLQAVIQLKITIYGEQT